MKNKKNVYDDDNLSKFSIMLGFASVIFFIIGITITLFNFYYINAAAILIFFSTLFSIIGYIVVNIAYKNENENIGRCIIAKRFNGILIIFFVLIYILSII